MIKMAENVMHKILRTEMLKTRGGRLNRLSRSEENDK